MSSFLLKIVSLFALSFSNSASNDEYDEYDEYDWCILNSMVNIRYKNECSDFSNYVSKSIYFSGMKGEYENTQLLFKYNKSMKRSKISFKTSSLINSTENVELPSSIIRLYQIGNVNCSSTPFYVFSGGGWRPDPIFEINDNLYGNNITISNEYTQGIWISINIPYNSKAPMIYNGNITVMIYHENENNYFDYFIIPITLNVWNITIPTTLNSKFQVVFAFDETVIPNFYNPRIYNITNIQYKYFDLLSSFRTPPDTLYTQPRPIADYEYLTTKTGWSNIADIANFSWIAKYNCSVTPQYIQEIINMLNITILDLEANGMDINSFYVYGFDEAQSYCLSAMYAVFNTLTSIWPNLRTMSAIDWKVMPPLNLDLDAWSVIYYYYNETQANEWINNGREQWLYHSCDPRDNRSLQTFIENPLMDSRLLFWLAPKWNASGWLYWSMNDWNGCIQGGIPNKTIIKPYTNNLTFTDFNPATYERCPSDTDIFVNGDGYYIYPGEYGPIPSIRLQNVRDGLEDIELLLMLENKQEMNYYISQIVNGPKNYTLDPILLQKIRNQVAAQVQKQQYH